MKSVFAAISLLAATALGAGCQSHPAMSSSPHEGSEKSRVISVAGDSLPAAPLRLGAGDTLGREVFAQAVAVARAGRGTDWLAEANDRAILPAFTPHDKAEITLLRERQDAELWALLTSPSEH